MISLIKSRSGEKLSRELLRSSVTKLNEGSNWDQFQGGKSRKGGTGNFLN